MSNAPSVEMFMDELFDGWLSAPSVAGFLAEDTPPSSTRQSPESISEPVLTPSNGSGPLSLDVQRINQSNNSGSRRRGNQKSRLGCMNCKKRKIKCQETWPSCANCNKRGFACRYPSVIQPAHQEYIPATVARRSLHAPILSDTPSYSGNDMRLFHYYLTTAYPSNGDDSKIWIKDIAQLSHQYSYLMHAILAMSASHMTIHSEESHINSALSHRQIAIAGLEDAFSRWAITEAEEAHVMLAASSLLATQSSFMPDAFLDSILSLRGCSLITQRILERKLKGIFYVAAEVYHGGLELRFKNFPHIDQQLVKECLGSIAEYIPLLTPSHRIERDLTTQVAETVRQLLAPLLDASESSTSPGTTEWSTDDSLSVSTSSTTETPSIKSPLVPYAISTSFEDIPWESLVNSPPSSTPNPRRSFEALMSTMLILFTWPPDLLICLFSPSNKVGAIVLAHLLAVRCIVSPLSSPPEMAMKTLVKTTVDWLDQILDGVEDDPNEKWRKYVAWPDRIRRCLKQCLLRKKTLNYYDLVDVVVNDPAAFEEGRSRRPIVVEQFGAYCTL